MAHSGYRFLKATKLGRGEPNLVGWTYVRYEWKETAVCRPETGSEKRRENVCAEGTWWHSQGAFSLVV